MRPPKLLLRTFSLFVSACALFLLAPTVVAASQVTPEEHAEHHPQEGAETPSKPEATGMGGMMGDGMGGGMGKGMGDMMSAMGVPPPKELYPSLMELPDLPMERRAEVQELAHTRMKEGTAGLSKGLERLSLAAPGDDFATMQDALEEMREGLAQFESGLAAHRALAEGSAPRSIAMQWFKREMSLVAPSGNPVSGGPFGFSWFHFFSMALLVGVAAVTAWLHFSKVRRTQELLAVLTASPDAPSLAADKLAGTSAMPSSVVESSASTPVGAKQAANDPVPVPVRSNWSGPMVVCRTYDEVPDVRTLRFMANDGGALPLSFLPGQFLTVAVEHEGKRVKRSYTIASSPTVRDYLEITVKREEHGIVSRILHDEVQEGDTLDITAPSGKFTFTGEEADSIVLIGGGVGITPLMSAVRYLTDRGWPKPIYLLFCCRTPKDYIFQEELAYLQRRNPNLTVIATMTRNGGTAWTGPTGRLTPELISSSVPDIERQRVHICGPEPMMDAVKSVLAGLQVPSSQVFTEAFGPAKKKTAEPATSTKTPEGQDAAVTFSSSSITVPIPASESVLDVADANGVDIDSSCRNGTCGACKVKILQGQVTMEVEDGLDAGEKDEGWILACQAMATEDLVIDA